MTHDSNNNSRIAKNTLFLYLRTLITIVVNIYSLRLLWNSLGVEDYGIFSLVGSFVMMFTFISSSMTGAIQRYMSFALGQGEIENLKTVFSISVKVQLILIAVVFILGETLGLWAVNYWLKIPNGKIVATNWVYQSCLISFMLNIINVPYNASIVAHEHMHVYGYFGIIEVFLKLGIILIISILPDYRLIGYSILLVMISIIMRLLYGYYCRRHFEECRYRHSKDNTLIKEMLNFSKWTLIGLMGFAARDGGIGIVLNRFFDMAVIAAKGVASQVGNVVAGFASNFTMAINPQIIKRYAAGNIKEMIELTSSGSKYSLLLMSFVVIPLSVAAELVLKLWLKDVAPYSVGFLRYVLLVGWIESVVSPITTAIQATGKIRTFQISISLIMLSILPIVWIWLKYDRDPYLVYITMAVLSIIAVFIRIILLRKLVPFNVSVFLKRVYARSIPAIVISLTASTYCYGWFDGNLIGLILFSISSVITTAIFTYFLALDKKEKDFVRNKASVILHKFHNK